MILAGVISLRINKYLEDLIQMHAREAQLDQSDVIRDLINKGGIFVAIKGHADGKYSVEKAASLANIPLSEFMDLLMGLGIRSKLDIDDMLNATEYLDSLLNK
jgi:predicted HTH domain antitoxin